MALIPNVMAARWIETTVRFSPFVTQSTACECEVYDQKFLRRRIPKFKSEIFIRNQDTSRANL